jgi:DNA ligase D-like protein (predicted 3'-phosphoesterase)
MPIFVVQKHAARALHYDFRLEVDGALASWAVPKGPSLNPREKRLAVRVEDHRLDYASFEGLLGPGYGAGAVIVWDTGEFVLVSGSLEEGHLVADLHGHKLRGGFALTRTGRDGDRERWLLVKVADEHADRERDIVAEEPASVLSGHTIEDLRETA